MATINKAKKASKQLRQAKKIEAKKPLTSHSSIGITKPTDVSSP